MNYVYAALLLHSAGKAIDEKSLRDVLSAAGISPDESRVKALVAALSEIDIDEALKTAVSAPAPIPAQPAEAKPSEEKKEEKPKEEKKEEALEGLGALFG
ncbi:MAG: 50S ribosomal protein P1 [Candidatus Bathyarchaeia archaeon]